MSTRNFYPVLASEPVILSVGDDYSLLASRQMVLQSAGYRVYSCASNVPLQRLLEIRADMVLICHTVDLSRAEALAGGLRQASPEVPLLFLSKFNGGQRDTCLHMMHPASDPASLLRQIERMLPPRELRRPANRHHYRSNSATA